MIDFLEALKRPFANWKALILGIGIGALPMINLLLLGFGLREAERVLNGTKKPVKWWHIGSILYYSIASFAIIVFYFSPVIMGSIFFLGPLLAELISIVEQSRVIELALWGSSPFELASLCLSVAGQLKAIAAENIPFIAPVAIIAIAFYYIMPLALVNFARERKIMAAFDLKAIRKAFNVKFLFYWLLFHFYLLALFSVLSLFFFLPVLNFLLGGFVLYVYASSGFNLFTQLFLEIK